MSIVPSLRARKWNRPRRLRCPQKCLRVRRPQSRCRLPPVIVRLARMTAATVADGDPGDGAIAAAGSPIRNTRARPSRVRRRLNRNRRPSKRRPPQAKNRASSCPANRSPSIVGPLPLPRRTPQTARRKLRPRSMPNQPARRSVMKSRTNTTKSSITHPRTRCPMRPRMNRRRNRR